MNPPIPQMTADELKIILADQNPEYLLIDVRTDQEREEANIGGLHIPLNLLADKISTIDTDKKIIVYCKSGGRSQRACEFLQEAGAKEVYNLAGGITGYL